MKTVYTHYDLTEARSIYIKYKYMITCISISFCGANINTLFIGNMLGISR